ncbi:MAG: tRNA-dihydrouridine synthase [Candidatus Omnitrophota bacterium]
MKKKIYLAPMAGVTTLPFRLICRDHGAKHCFFEMLHSNSVIYDNPGALRIPATHANDAPISAQLLGSDPARMLEAAHRIMAAATVVSLDVNSACPVKKVIRKGEGAALLANRPLLGRILKKLSSALPIPVSVKLRTGFKKSDRKECARTAKICEAHGASVIYIHGRTQAQGYAGDVDYASIRAVKEAVAIPVFGSGNVFDHLLAKKMLDETGCDGILVARGAQGNPWIFKDIENFLAEGRSPRQRSLASKKKALKEHLALMDALSELAPEHKIGVMGQVAVWYLKGFPNAARIRGEVFKAKTYEALIALIDSIREDAIPRPRSER